MLDQNLIDKIDVYLKPDYIEIVEGKSQLTEEEDSGRTRLNVSLSGTNSYLCIRDNDHKATCEFLNKTKTTGLGRSVDHILLTRNDNGKWTAHLIEMKSGVSIKRWNEIKLKARASMLNIKALAAVLDISLESIVVYTTYEKLVLGVSDPTNLAGRKPMLGGGWKENEWDKNRIAIRIPKDREEYLTHKGIKMTKERIDAFDVLCGELSLA